MQTRLPRPTQLLGLGLCALACLVVLLAVWRSFGGSVPLAAKSYRVTLQLPEASNVFAGTDVRTAGVDIGEVVDVERTGNAASVELELKPDFAPLRTRAHAILRTKTLLGEPYVEIAPGPSDARSIPDGGALAAARVDRAERLDDVLSTFAPGTRAHMRSALAGFATALRGNGGNLNDLLGHAAPATERTDDLVGALDAQRGDLAALLSNAGTILDAVGQRDATLQAAVAAGDDVLTTTGRRDRELAATVEALPPLLTQLRHTSDGLGAASDEVNTAVAALSPVATRAVPALRGLYDAAPEFRSLFAALPQALRAGERGLPRVAPIADAARAALPQLHRSMRDLLPLAELASANRRSIVGVLANVGQIFNGTYRGSQGRLGGYVTGLPTVWNEVLGGWVKRLPTNRFNPYPKPDSALDVGGSGLKSFDCRNLHNPLYLPAFGAAPPCLEQGPWSLGAGKPAYYPRLEKAAP